MGPPGPGRRDTAQDGVAYDRDWLAAAIDRDIHDPFDLYAREQSASVAAVAAHLHLPLPTDSPRTGSPRTDSPPTDQERP